MTHVPCVLNGDKAALLGHLTPDWFRRTGAGSVDAVAVFNGGGYISPGIAPQNQHGRVVPTWNDTNVEVREAHKLDDNPAAIQLCRRADGANRQTKPWRCRTRRASIPKTELRDRRYRAGAAHDDDHANSAKTSPVRPVGRVSGLQLLGTYIAPPWRMKCYKKSKPMRYLLANVTVATC